MKKALVPVTIAVIVVVIVIALVLSVGKTRMNSPVADDAGLGSRPVTITFWHSASDNAGVLMDHIISDFNSTNEYGITVRGIYQGQYSDSTSLMRTMISAENYADLPDVMQLDATGKVDFINSGKAFTVDDAQECFGDDILADYLPGAIGNWVFRGVQLGLPFATSTTVTYYNMDLLSKAGWERCPETFSDFIQLGKDMKAAGIDVPVFGTVPNTPTLANWLGQMGSDLVDNGNGNDDTATSLACIDNGALLEFLKAWKELYDGGALVNSSLSSSHFVSGEVAVFTYSSSSVNSVLQKVDGRFEVAVGSFPRVDESYGYGSTPSGSCLVMFDSGDQLRKAAAWEFLKYMTGREVQVEYSIGTGYIPSCRAAVDCDEYRRFLEDRPQFAAALDQLEKTSPSMRSVTVGPANDFYYAIMKNISEMLDKGLSTEETATRMNDGLQSLLNQYLRNNS